MKKNKIAAVLLLAAVTAASSFGAVAAYEPADIYITLDGLLKKSEAQPIIVDGYTMVSLREISELLGAEINWNPDTKVAKVQMSNRYVEMKVGEKTANINYQKVEMPVAPIIDNDRVMVPLRFISEEYRLNVNWDEDKRLVDIVSGKEAYSVLEARPEVDLGEDGVEMTFGEAVKQINSIDTSLKNIDDTLVVLKRNKKDLDDYITDYIGNINSGLSKVYDEKQIEQFRKQRTLNNSIKTVETNALIIKASNVLQLQSALTEIEKTELDIFLLKEKMKLDETNLSNMQLKLSLGLETQSNITSLENSMAKDKITVNTLEIKQNNNNLTLNKLLGVDASKKVRITDVDQNTREYEDNIELFVKEQLKSAPTITLKEIDLDNATWVKTTYYELLWQFMREEKTEDNEDPMVVIEMENDIATAQRALDDAKRTLEQKIRTNYNSIKQLEQSYDSLKVDYEIAKNSYKQVVMNYVTGYATIFDVEQAQFGLLNAEVNLLTNRINYRITVENFKASYLSTASQSQQ